MATFFCLQGGRCREVQLHVASDKLYKTISAAELNEVCR